MSEPVLLADRLTKVFRLAGSRTLLARIAHGRGERRVLEAVQDVTFEIARGEVVGIIGANGSGKSTLLRLLSGIYVPTSGRVTARGRVVPLINLSIGMFDRLTMRDNIFLVAAMLKVDRSAIVRSFGAIVEFAGLPSFVDEKIYRFSNGMLQRLAFSIALHVNPDILVLDEVFESEDASFRLRSREALRTLTRSGRLAVLLASHEEEILRETCTRLLWLREGKIVRDGPVEEILAAYRSVPAETLQ